MPWIKPEFDLPIAGENVHITYRPQLGDDDIQSGGPHTRQR